MEINGKKKKRTGHLICKQFNFDVMSCLLDLVLGKIKEQVVDLLSLLFSLFPNSFNVDGILIKSSAPVFFHVLYFILLHYKVQFLLE